MLFRSGWLGSALRRRPRYGDAEFRKYLRRYQWQVLCRGKKAAVASLEESGKSVWQACKLR